MERFLMDRCFNYQERTCQVEDVINARMSQEGALPRVFPFGEEQRKLDQICEKCPDRLFEIDAPICPACQGEIKRAIVTEETAGAVKPSWTIYHYRCRQCQSPLYSSKRMI
jgi:ribosomal protein L37E